MAAPPPISPDGEYWWDGQTWQRILKDPALEGAEPVALEPNVQAPAGTAPTRPMRQIQSWLPDDMDPPIPAYPYTVQRITDTSPPVATVPPPAWGKPKKPSRIRTAINPRTATLAVIAIVALLVVGTGVWALHTYGPPRLPSFSNRTSPQPIASAQPSPTPTIQGPLTALIAGSACPVAHVGDAACWKVTFKNSGPAILDLAMIFSVDSPYSSWFRHHFSADLPASDNLSGCVLDVINYQVLCGSVPAGGQVTIHLTGYVAGVGTWMYGVRFADLGQGFANDINVKSDGSLSILSWTEKIT